MRLTDRLAALLHENGVGCWTGATCSPMAHAASAARLIAAGVTLLDEDRLAIAIAKARRDGRQHRREAAAIARAYREDSDE